MNGHANGCAVEARSNVKGDTVLGAKRPRRYGSVGKLALLALSTTALVGCAVKPQPITQAEHFERAKQDYKDLYKTYVPINGPLSLSEAIARALKYNYDAELSKEEITLQQKQFDLAMTQMLPKLAASAGYDWRSNDNAAESVSELTKQQSLEYSFSEQPAHGTAGLELSWNMLDLGVSYFQAKQQGYRAYVAVERRRKVIDSIVKGVQAAYWNALAADRLLPKLNPLLAHAQQILAASREATRNKLQPQLQALDFQANLLQVIGQLQRMQTDMNTAKVQLASLINVPIDTPMTFATNVVDVPPPSGSVNPRELENLGLALRPELREEAYQAKIDQQDVYKEMVKMLPGVGFLGNINYDSNRYLFNNSWGGLGIQATYNLVNLIEGPKAIEAAKTSVEVSKIRRLALSVAVLTQVNLSYQEYLAAQRDLNITRQVADVQRQIAVASANETKAHTQSEADEVRRELAGMSAEFAYDQSLAQVHTSLVNLYIATGVDIVPPTVDTDDLKTLSGKVHLAIEDWEKGDLPTVTAPGVAAQVAAPAQVSSATGEPHPAPAAPTDGTASAKPMVVAVKDEVVADQ